MTHRFFLGLVAALLAVGLFAGCGNKYSKITLAQLDGVDTSRFITLAEAVDIAQNEVPDGFAIEAILEIEDDDEDEPPVYEVALFVDGSNEIIEVEVHAETGAVLEVETRENGEDDDEGDG